MEEKFQAQNMTNLQIERFDSPSGLKRIKENG